MTDPLERAIDSRNKLNDLTASEWITRTVSVMTQKGLGKASKHAEIERKHPAPFSYQDITRFIEFFTKRGDLVLDPFCGVGSTLKAAVLLERNSVGIELSPYFSELAEKRLETEVEKEKVCKVESTILSGDVRIVARQLLADSIDFIITSPPYWGILNKVDHKAKQERLSQGLSHNYGNADADLANIATYDNFLLELASIFNQLSTKLKSQRYLVVIVGDFRHKDRYYMFHSDLADIVQEHGPFALKGLTIIHQKHKRVFPYGYPYSYVPNIHHQYAMIFQKTG